MALYTRLLGHGAASGHIDPAAFIAALQENVRDQLTVTQIDSAFSFDTNESNEWQTLVNRFVEDPVVLTPEAALEVLLLARLDLAYGTETEVQTRLGV
jgi:hypothetical protein